MTKLMTKLIHRMSQVLSARAPLFGLAFLGLVAGVSPARAGGPCKAVQKELRALAKNQRTARNPLSRGSASAKAQARLSDLAQRVQSSAKRCDWERVLTQSAILGPYAVAWADADQAGRARVVSAYLALQAHFMALLPDDMVCNVIGRRVKAGRGSSLCFKGQLSGATPKNLRLLAQGWCQQRKASMSSRQFGIETNQIAALFQAPEAPDDLTEQMLNSLVDAACPATR